MTFGLLLKELSQVHIAKLLDKEYDCVFHHYVFEGDDVFVLEVHQDCYFAHCCGWDSIVAVIDFSLFNGKCLIGLLVATLVDNPIGTMAKISLVNIHV